MKRGAAIWPATAPATTRRQALDPASGLASGLAKGLGFGALLVALALGLPRPADAMTTSSTVSALAADATPAALLPLPANGAAWQQWGSGEMRFFGFRLYRATLWVAGAGIEDAPRALSLQYRRNISRQQLVDASLEEMSRLGGDSIDNKAARWQDELQRVFPDVKTGERIIGIHLPGEGARFYHQGRLTGEIKDPEFARHFFAIWLDPRTRSPEVRALLLKRPASASGG